MKIRKGKCQFCKKNQDEDNYCFGCNVFICDSCELLLNNYQAPYTENHLPIHHVLFVTHQLNSLVDQYPSVP